jgi:hypothetical protein
MGTICLTIEIHQPVRLGTYRFYDIKNNHYYYNDYENEYYIRQAAEKVYKPANRLLLDLVQTYKDDLFITFLFSGVILDEFELYAPELILSYKNLIDSSNVALLSGTYSNIFGPPYNYTVLANQLIQHDRKIRSSFGKKPVRLPGRIKRCHPAGISGSEMISRLMNESPDDSDVFRIFIPYYISGDYREANPPLLIFLESFPGKVLSESNFVFANPSKTYAHYFYHTPSEYTFNYPHKEFRHFHSSCNELQNNAYEKLYSLSGKINICDDPLINKDWLYLQSCDHFLYMDQSIYDHNVSPVPDIPYESPHFAYINYMNILTDFNDRLDRWLSDSAGDHPDYITRTGTIREDLQRIRLSGIHDYIFADLTN